MNDTMACVVDRVTSIVIDKHLPDCNRKKLYIEALLSITGVILSNDRFGKNFYCYIYGDCKDRKSVV